jgi:hypothetical protein
LLILQTDLDGLEKLKNESTFSNDYSSNHNHQSKKMNNNNPDESAEFSFDVCEISEKVTSV